jgi:hypothetical protein
MSAEGLAALAALLLFGVVYVLGVVWVYRDAKRRGNAAWFWALAALLFWLPTLFIYLVTTHRDAITSSPG